MQQTYGGMRCGRGDAGDGSRPLPADKAVVLGKLLVMGVPVMAILDGVLNLLAKSKV